MSLLYSWKVLNLWSWSYLIDRSFWIWFVRYRWFIFTLNPSIGRLCFLCSQDRCFFTALNPVYEFTGLKSRLIVRRSLLCNLTKWCICWHELIHPHIGANLPGFVLEQYWLSAAAKLWLRDSLLTRSPLLLRWAELREIFGKVLQVLHFVLSLVLGLLRVHVLGINTDRIGWDGAWVDELIVCSG